MDLPNVKQKDQANPAFTPAHVNSIMEHSKGRYGVLYALLAGTGLRIGEALPLRINDDEGTTLSSDCRTLYVRNASGTARSKSRKRTTLSAKLTWPLIWPNC